MLKRISLSVVEFVVFTLLIAGVSLAHAKSCADDSLESVSDDGSILKMLSGQVFEVEAGDTIDAALWLPVDDVLICEVAESAVEIINTDENGEKASAQRLRARDSARNLASPHLPPGFATQPRKGSAQGGEYDDLIPKQQTKRKGEYDDLLPQQGPRRPPGPIDPLNMARQEAAQAQAATTSAGADTATTPAPAEEQKAENARPVEVTPHPGIDTAKAAAPAAPAPPAKAPVGDALPTIEDLPQYKFAREIEHSQVVRGSAESGYLTTVYGMIKAHLHETAELHVENANKPGVVDFYVDQGGNLVGRKLASSSGSPNLDSAVMTAIAAAAPYPAPPNWRPLYLNYNFGKRAELNTDTSATAAPAPIVPSVPPPAVGQPATAPAGADTATAPATQTYSYSKVGVVDNTLIIGHFANTNPDCTASGKTFVRVSRPPSHGVVNMQEGLGFSHFAKTPECNSHKIQGVTVEYVPERGFTGSDEIGLDVIYQVGTEGLFTYSVTIK